MKKKVWKLIAVTAVCIISFIACDKDELDGVNPNVTAITGSTSSTSSTGNTSSGSTTTSSNTTSSSSSTGTTGTTSTTSTTSSTAGTTGTTSTTSTTSSTSTTGFTSTTGTTSTTVGTTGTTSTTSTTSTTVGTTGTTSSTTSTTSTSSTTATTATTSSTSGSTTGTPSGSWYTRGGVTNSNLTVTYDGLNYAYTGTLGFNSVTIRFGTVVGVGQTSFTVVQNNPAGLTQCMLFVSETGNIYNALSGTVTKTIVNNKYNFAFNNLPLNNGGGTISGLLKAP